MIKIVLGDMQKSENGTILSRFCLFVQGKYFPEREWEDFSASILDDWLIRLGSICAEPWKKEKLYFMEGVYYLHVQFVQADVLKISLVEEHEREYMFGHVGFQDFFTEVLHAAEKLCDLLKENHMEATEDFISLCDTLEKAKALKH